jgi:hypothetical protein
MKTNSQSLKNLSIIKLTIFIFCSFFTMQNSSADVLKADLSNFQESVKSDEPSLIIKGILIDNEGKPLGRKLMTIYIANKKTTIDTHKDEPKKAGLGKQIKGTGTLAMSIEGVKDGGALKLIDGAVSNPQAKTNENGNFQLNASAKFVDGESELIITVELTDNSSIVSKSYPLMDEEGNPLILKINKDSKVIELGKVRMLKE